jgi:hypothetical protein
VNARSRRLGPAALLGLAAAGLGAGCSASSAEGTRSVSVAKTADGTVVSISDDLAEPENDVCSRYCKQLAKCWYALPNVDSSLRSDDVLRKCRQEQQGCRTPTTELLCCGLVDECTDFSPCNSRGRDIVSDCKYTLRRDR